MAEIIRDRTWTWLRDNAGVEWDVSDLWAGHEGRGAIERHPGDKRAIARIFRRTERIAGGDRRRLLEERRYDFGPDDSRWFNSDVWQLQLEMAYTVPV